MKVIFMIFYRPRPAEFDEREEIDTPEPSNSEHTVQPFGIPVKCRDPEVINIYTRTQQIGFIRMCFLSQQLF